MASSLNHPHIAHVYEVGEDGERLFIAMELVEGRTLRASIPAAGMHAETLLRRIGSPDDVAEAVSYLAGAGYVTGTTLFVDGGRSLQSGRRSSS